MSVLLLYGDNALELGEAARTVRERFNPVDVITLDGATVPLPTLSDATRTAGLFDPERLIVVHALHERLKAGRKEPAEGEALARILGGIAPTTTLLLLSPGLPAEHAFVHLVRSVGGTVRVFGAPRRTELPRWIAARARGRDIAIDREAADLLAEAIGADPVALDTELTKLSVYAGRERAITAHMVETLVGTITQETIFALIDAIADGNQGVAFSLLRAQVAAASSGPTEVAMYLIRLLARQVRLLLRVQAGQEAGRSRAEIIGQLKLQRYYADRYFRQATRLSRPKLIGAFEQLANFEQALKTSTVDPATGLDLLVASLAA